MKGEFYKMDFEAWDEGTFELTLEEEAAYLRLCHQMYRRQGPIPNTTRLLCAIFRCHHVKALALVKRLIGAGKIGLTDEGFLTNNRVTTELQARDKVRASRQEAGHKGGTRSAQARSKPLKNNQAHGANASTGGKQNEAEERRGEKNTPVVPMGTLNEEFEELWPAYPKRQGTNSKAAAREAYCRARRAGMSREDAVDAVACYAAEMRAAGKECTEFVKQGEFFFSLSKRLWEDYAARMRERRQHAEARTTGGISAGWSDDRWREEVQRWRGRGGHWPWRNVTPPPDAPDTQVPRHILAELNIHPERRRAA